MFTATLFIIAKKWKYPFTDELINKMWYIHSIECCDKKE